MQPVLKGLSAWQRNALTLGVFAFCIVGDIVSGLMISAMETDALLWFCLGFWLAALVGWVALVRPSRWAGICAIGSFVPSIFLIGIVAAYGFSALL